MLKQKLALVWAHGQIIGAERDATPYRYLPKSLNGGIGWRVWDRKLAKFLSDREVTKVANDELRDELVTH